MIRIFSFLVLMLTVALASAWLGARPGQVIVNWPWLGSGIETSLHYAVIFYALCLVFSVIVWRSAVTFARMPKIYANWQKNRRRSKGYESLSRGWIACRSEQLLIAKRCARTARKLLPDEPLARLLESEIALLEGDRTRAKEIYREMIKDEKTRLLGLRGLYGQASEEGDTESLHYLARQAQATDIDSAWVNKAVVKAQAAKGEWENALKALEVGRTGKLYDASDYRRKKAVLLTALAQSLEDENPEQSFAHALAAHKLAPDLAPAGLLAAKFYARKGRVKRASAILEHVWRHAAHPEIAENYVYLPPGISAAERVKRAENLIAKRDHREGRLALAAAALDAKQWQNARTALEKVLKSEPTKKAYLLMADLEEAQHGDRIRARKYVSMAVDAPPDPVWIADSCVSSRWAPISPVSGELDAFEWRMPDVSADGAGGAGARQSLGLDRPESPERESETEGSGMEESGTDESGMDENGMDKNGGKETDAENGGQNGRQNGSKSAKERNGEKSEKKKAKEESENVSAADSAPLSMGETGELSRPPDDPGPEQSAEKKRRNFFF